MKGERTRAACLRSALAPELSAMAVTTDAMVSAAYAVTDTFTQALLAKLERNAAYARGEVMP